MNNKLSYIYFLGLQYTTKRNGKSIQNLDNDNNVFRTIFEYLL
jgi:hypothetical protein